MGKFYSKKCTELSKGSKKKIYVRNLFQEMPKYNWNKSRNFNKIKQKKQCRSKRSKIIVCTQNVMKLYEIFLCDPERFLKEQALNTKSLYLKSFRWTLIIPRTNN